MPCSKPSSLLKASTNEASLAPLTPKPSQGSPSFQANEHQQPIFLERGRRRRGRLRQPEQFRRGLCGSADRRHRRRRQPRPRAPHSPRPSHPLGAVQHPPTGAKPAQQDAEREGGGRRARPRGRWRAGSRGAGVGAERIGGGADGGRRRLLLGRQQGVAAAVCGGSGHSLGHLQHSAACTEPDQQDEVWVMVGCLNRRLRSNSISSICMQNSLCHINDAGLR
ncbi:unnamed protein product [Musa textilis]